MGEFKPQSISFSAVNILFSITATLGNSLILATLHKESSLHPPSKLLYRCLATTDLLVVLVTQPVAATYWMSLVHEHWIRYPRDVGYITGFTLRGVWSFSVYNDGHKREPTSRRVVGTEIQRYCHSEVHVHHFSYRLGCISSRWFILSSRSPYNLMVQPYKYIIFRALSHHRAQIQDHAQQQPSQPNALNMERYRKAVYSALWVQLALVVCYVPQFTMQIVISLSTKQFPNFFIFPGMANVLLFLNSTLNLFLYCWGISEVRRAVKQTIRQAICYA